MKILGIVSIFTPEQTLAPCITIGWLKKRLSINSAFRGSACGRTEILWQDHYLYEVSEKFREIEHETGNRDGEDGSSWSS